MKLQHLMFRDFHLHKHMLALSVTYSYSNTIDQVCLENWKLIDKLQQGLEANINNWCGHVT
jgi:hypothetical protein